MDSCFGFAPWHEAWLYAAAFRLLPPAMTPRLYPAGVSALPPDLRRWLCPAGKNGQ